MKIAIVGAGLAGATVAHQLVPFHQVEIFEARSHVAGNAHTYRDNETHVMVHAYGPHIFATKNERVLQYVRQFAHFEPFVLRPKAIVGRQVYSMPINLHTINQFFGLDLTPAAARIFINSKVANIEFPQNFEEAALAAIGGQLYEAFFKHYTIKQWGRSPIEIPPSVFARLPIRYTYEDNKSFDGTFQGIPPFGYTDIVGEMVEDCHVHLDTPVTAKDLTRYDHIFCTAPIDAWFDHVYGRLSYRTLDFVGERSTGDAQGTAVLYHCDPGTAYTRTTEHKYFTPGEQHEQTILFKEYSRECGPDDEPYYPIRLPSDKLLMFRYLELAQNHSEYTFLGRLGTYRYIDMDVTIAEALAIAEKFK